MVTTLHTLRDSSLTIVSSIFKIQETIIQNDVCYCRLNLYACYQVCTGHLLAVASLHYQPVKVLKFTEDGVHVLSGGDDGRVVVWRLARYIPISVIVRAAHALILFLVMTHYKYTFMASVSTVLNLKQWSCKASALIGIVFVHFLLYY